MVLLGALLASCGGQPKRDAQTAHLLSTPVTLPAPAEPQPAVTVAAVGDIMLGTDYPDNILPDDDGVGFLADVTPVLSAADIAFGNLEGVLMDGGEPVKRCGPAKNAPTAATAPASNPRIAQERRSGAGESASPPPGENETMENAEALSASSAATPSASEPSEQMGQSGPDAAVQAPVTSGSCYVFRSPTRYANYLRDAGFDVMSLANNHAQDFGDLGRDSSMQALDAVGIRHSGREGDVAEWNVQGRRVALVAFAPNVGSHQLNDLVRAQEIVTALADRNDIVIVSFHGGAEGEGASILPFARETFHGEDRGDVVEFARTVVDAGADLVLGHGPHVLRPLELYRDRLIAYSLGNFATYYGISVNGIRGLAGVLVARLADDGRFLDGRFESTIQIRPAGPTLDPAARGAALLRELTAVAFPQGSLRIEPDGRILRIP